MARQGALSSFFLPLCLPMTQQPYSFSRCPIPCAFYSQFPSQLPRPFHLLYPPGIHSLPFPCFYTPLLPILLPSLLSFDHHSYPLYTVMILTYLIQHRLPILPLTHTHPGQSVCPQQDFGQPASTLLLGSCLLSSPLLNQAGAASDLVLGAGVQ